MGKDDLSQRLEFRIDQESDGHLLVVLVGVTQELKETLFRKRDDGSYEPRFDFVEMVDNFINEALDKLPYNFQQGTPTLCVAALPKDEEFHLVSFELFNLEECEEVDLERDSLLYKNAQSESCVVKNLVEVVINADEESIDMIEINNSSDDEFKMLEEVLDSDIPPTKTYRFSKRDYLSKCLLYGEFLTAAARSTPYIIKNQIYLKAKNDDDSFMLYSYDGENIESKLFDWAKEKGKLYEKTTRELLLL